MYTKGHLIKLTHSCGDVFVICLCLHAVACNNAAVPVDNMSVSASSAVCEDVVSFHERCGTLVKLSNGHRTAERQRPLDEFNNGVVMTARPLRSDERFEVSLLGCHF